jgi:hypothetical protein
MEIEATYLYETKDGKAHSSFSDGASHSLTIITDTEKVSSSKEEVIQVIKVEFEKAHERLGKKVSLVPFDEEKILWR